MSVVQLYGGSVELGFDRHRHTYTVDGEAVPNVTTITGVIAKQGLDGWAMRMALEHLRVGLKGRPDEVQLQRLFEEAALAAEKVKQEGGYVGRATHEWIEEHTEPLISSGREGDGRAVRPLPTSAPVRAAVEAFLEWERVARPIYLHSERKVYSREHNYTGTVDAVALIEGSLIDTWRLAKRGRVLEAAKELLGRRRTTLDYKTGNKVMTEAHLQIRAYDQALSEEDGVLSDERIILHLPKVAGKSARPIVCGDHEADLEAFLAVRRVYRRIFGR